MEKDKLNIYVIMHKVVDLNKLKLPNIYKRLLVGQKDCKENDILLDSTGDNISNKNKNYCELTGLYWIWKNTNTEYVGLCHYRRFFVNNFTLKILKEKEIFKILKKYDVIVPSHMKLRTNIYEQYKKEHFITDMDACRNIIEIKYPEYIESFDKVMKRDCFFQFNMFIMKKKLLDEYCIWLFDILEQIEKETNVLDREVYQQRIYGFLSERLFNVWILKNELIVFENTVLNTEKDTNILKRLRKRISTLVRKMHLR